MFLRFSKIEFSGPKIQNFLKKKVIPKTKKP